MATAWIRPEAFEALPGVCVKTGAPTEIRIPVVADYVPAALRWLQLFSVWSFVFGRSAEARRRHVRLPVSRGAFRRYRAWQLSCVFVFVAGIGVGLSGSLSLHPLVELVGYGGAAAGFVVGVRAQHMTWVGLTVDRKGREVTITRCHPDFARAAGRVAGARRR
jgi:hypothetical protein